MLKVTTGLTSKGIGEQSVPYLESTQPPLFLIVFFIKKRCHLII